MKKIFVFALLLSVIFTNFVLPCEKANAANVRYWICGTCGQKAKSLKGWKPKTEVYGDRFGSIIHWHLWQEVDYQTWITW